MQDQLDGPGGNIGVVVVIVQVDEGGIIVGLLLSHEGNVILFGISFCIAVGWSVDSDGTENAVLEFIRGKFIHANMLYTGGNTYGY